jgi:hypothetical protein
MTYIWRSNGVALLYEFSFQTNSSFTVTNAQDTAQFSVVITNGYGFPAFSSNATLTVGEPGIIQQPADIAVFPGSIVRFEVIPCGNEPLSFQWFKGQPPVYLFNGPRISGATNQVLYISNAIPSDSGLYRVRVTNYWGSVTSLTANCFVGFPPTVTNLLSRIVRFQGSTTFSPIYTGSSLMFQWFRDDVSISTNSILILTNIERPQVGLYHVEVSNPIGSAVSENAHLQLRLTYESASPIFLEEATDDLDSLSNAIPSLQATSIFHGAPLLFSTYHATAQYWESNHCGVLATHSMWLKYYSPRKDSVKVSTEGSSFDTVVAVYSRNLVTGALTLLECDDNGGRYATSLLNFNAEAERNYYIAVDGVNGAEGIVRLQVGEIIRNAFYDRAKGIYRFEVPGHLWFYNHLLSTTTLTNSLPNWQVVTTVPPAAVDWVLRYTNFNAASDLRRFYSVKLNTNAAVLNLGTGTPPQ